MTEQKSENNERFARCRDYDIEITDMVTSMADMLLDIRDACNGVRVDPDNISFIAVDRDEAQEIILKTANELCRCAFKYAADARTYEAALGARGIDIRKILAPDEFEARSNKIRESLEKELIKSTPWQRPAIAVKGERVNETS